jgi:hypothetical protein
MAAWRHSAIWTPTAYEQYRGYVIENAPKKRGATPDCADISLTLLIEFAASKGLPVTLRNRSRFRFISKATRQSPTTHLSPHRSFSWKTRDQFLEAVRNRLNAVSVYNDNTVVNGRGPEPGDLMCKPDHVALVFKMYPPGLPHPRANDKRIPLFPGERAAAQQLNTTEYFREDPRAPNSHVHIDYLNHRGEGTPRKQAAELIYFADAFKIRQMGFEFRMYSRDVLDNWLDWNGEGDPPR